LKDCDEFVGGCGEGNVGRSGNWIACGGTGGVIGNEEGSAGMETVTGEGDTLVAQDLERALVVVFRVPLFKSTSTSSMGDSILRGDTGRTGIC